MNKQILCLYPVAVVLLSVLGLASCDTWIDCDMDPKKLKTKSLVWENLRIEYSDSLEDNYQYFLLGDTAVRYNQCALHLEFQTDSVSIII